MARLSKALKKQRIKALSDAAYSLIAQLEGDQRRLHLSQAPCNLRYREPNDKLKSRWASVKKPWGLWYGFGSSWMEWSLSEYACMLRPYVYEVIIKDETKIKKINNNEEFEAFEEEYWARDAMFRELNQLYPGIDFSFPDILPYGLSMDRIIGSIDWPLVSQRYSAVEINPYLYEKRLDSLWYYGWDCASGCIWDASVLELRLVAAFDQEHGVYVRR